MRYLILLLLTACATAQHADPVRITVQVMPSVDEVCSQFGRPRACAINGTAYIQGKRQFVSMLIDPEYINSLPDDDEGEAGDMLADKLGLDLEFNRREELGHEALRHIFSDTKHGNRGTPSIMSILSGTT